MTESVLTANPVSAAPGDPFDPSRPTVFIVQSDTGAGAQLQRSETSGTGDFQFIAEGPESEGRYNAIGWNRADGYIYGVTTSVIGSIPVRSVIRVGESGTIERVGTSTIGTTNQWSGAFNTDDGLFYTAGGFADPSLDMNLYGIDPTTGNVVSATPLTNTLAFADFEYFNGYFWAMATDGTSILRIDPSTGVTDTFDVTAFGFPAGSYGGAWIFGNGNLGFSHNGTGDILQIKVTNPTSISPTIELIGTFQGPSAANNDGTSIPGDPVDLSIEKLAPATYAPGEQITYTVVVTNNGLGESSGWVVQDQLPDGVTLIQTDGDASCNPSSIPNLSCVGGRLGVGESATINITVETPDIASECLTNVASVLGNELDPVVDNNTSTVVSCPRALFIEKTSTATVDTRAGDEVTYTVTATNTGAGDYTVADPAFVFDDLSGLLDDADYNNNAGANRPGDVLYEAPLLSWSGALGSGDSVELSYTVTAKGGGDGEARNLAWVPNDPNIPLTPACDPPNGDGEDPTTGEPCAEAVFELPRLLIFKSADRTDLPSVGGIVTYTIMLTNTGPGNYTVDAPAQMTDDLSKVLDDADFDNNAVAQDSGGNPMPDQPNFTSPNLSWSGALAAGEAVTITYSVTYTAAGDRVLINNACVPEADADPASGPCDFVQIPGSALTQWKTVTASDDPAVAGTTLTYRLFFKNSGPATADVDAVDNLLQVVDDADLLDAPVVDGPGLTPTLNGAGDEIVIRGTIDPYTSRTVTYTVTVRPDGLRGDDIASNFLLNAGEDPPTEPSCTPMDAQLPTCTTTPIAAVAYAKSVEASEDPLSSGTVLTYTVTVQNHGAATAPLVREDVLTDVLDDAALTSGPVSDTDSVTVSSVANDRFTIGGELASYTIAKITYQVTINAETDRGNNSAANFLVPQGEDPPTTCEDGSNQCTVTPLPLIEASKTVDVISGTTVSSGDELVYTLTFKNVGTGAGTLDYTDHMVEILDDADLVGTPTASAGLNLTGPESNVLHITGSVQPGESSTAIYSVKVKSYDEQADHHLRNFLTIAGEQRPSQCESANPLCTQNPIDPVAISSLPNTGADISLTTILAALLAVGTGAGLLLIARRRRV